MKDDKSDLYEGLGIGIIILALCIGIGSCDLLMKKGDAELKKIDMQKEKSHE